MVESGCFLLFSHFSQEIPEAAPTKEDRGRSAIDVTSLATGVNASGSRFADWSNSFDSVPDWLEPG